MTTQTLDREVSTRKGREKLHEQSKGEGYEHARMLLLKEIIPMWQRPCAVLEFDGKFYIDSVTGLLEFNVEEFRQELSAEHYSVFLAILDELKLQARTAFVAFLLANAELCLQQKRVDGGVKGARKSRRKSRSIVENLMRAALERGENPRRYFPAWAEEFDYSSRQLGNILRSIRKEMPNPIS